MVAWHEVPGKAEIWNPSRRVRYDRFPAAVIFWDIIIAWLEESYCTLRGGRRLTIFQALRARLPSFVPPGLSNPRTFIL